MGTAGIKSKKRGRKEGEFRLLSAEQEKFVQKAITDKMPDQMELTYALWTRKAVQEQISREFKVKIAINTVGLYLNGWGFTPQKPKKQAYEQCPIKVKKWLEEEYPAIREQARREGAVHDL
ncbi:MAG: winged helix-turn-helix domain-containing protein [Cytophagales bacterium]|nr:winged helix-turn-helix domain-containing protein [Cytophagales bacterium]